jgi:chromosomal replication initiation ATPase DnaA
VNSWEQILEIVREKVPPEDFRRWFGAAGYASDSWDQITIWVPTEATRQQILGRYQKEIEQALDALDRRGTRIRIVVAGIDEDEDDEEEGR